LYQKSAPECQSAFIVACFFRNAKEFVITAAVARVHSIRNSFYQSSIAKYHLSESWPTGSIVFWISVILATYLLVDGIKYAFQKIDFPEAIKRMCCLL